MNRHRTEGTTDLICIICEEEFVGSNDLTIDGDGPECDRCYREGARLLDDPSDDGQAFS